MHIRKTALLILLSGLTGEMKASFLSDTVPYLLVGGASLYGCYMLHSYHELAYKLEKTKLALAENSLANLTTLMVSSVENTLEDMSKNYDIFLREDNVLDSSDETLILYLELYDRLQSADSIASLESNLVSDLETLRECKNTLAVTLESTIETRMNLEKDEKANTRGALSQTLLEKSSRMISYTEKLIDALEVHKPFFIFEREVLQYAGEIRIISDDIDKMYEFAKTLKECWDDPQADFSAIAQYWSEVKSSDFSAMIEYLSGVKSFLEKAMKNLEQYQPFDFQHDLFVQARKIISVIDSPMLYLKNIQDLVPHMDQLILSKIEEQACSQKFTEKQ